MPEKYIHRVLQEAKDTFQLLIEGGGVDMLHPETDVSPGELIEGRDIIITTRPYLKYLWSKVVLNVQQCIDAVSLLERCGWLRGIYEEMWAFIWAGNVQIGYIWLMQEKMEPWMLGEGNVTAAAAAAAAAGS